MAKFPMVPGMAAYIGMILAIAFCAAAGYEFYRRRKGVMAMGIWGWLFHEIPELAMITLLLAGIGPLTKVLSQVFFMGLALVGPMVMLGSVLYLYFGRDIERTLSWMSMIVVVFFSLTAFFYFTPGLPLAVRSVLIYIPVSPSAPSRPSCCGGGKKTENYRKIVLRLLGSRVGARAPRSDNIASAAPRPRARNSGSGGAVHDSPSGVRHHAIRRPHHMVVLREEAVVNGQMEGNTQTFIRRVPRRMVLPA